MPEVLLYSTSLSVALAASIARLAEAMLTLAVVTVTVFTLHSTIAVFLPWRHIVICVFPYLRCLTISASLVAGGLAVDLSLFTLTVVALAVGALRRIPICEENPRP
jgi:hypothetical protein